MEAMWQLKGDYVSYTGYLKPLSRADYTLTTTSTLLQLDFILFNFSKVCELWFVSTWAA